MPVTRTCVGLSYFLVAEDYVRHLEKIEAIVNVCGRTTTNLQQAIPQTETRTRCLYLIVGCKLKSSSVVQLTLLAKVKRKQSKRLGSPVNTTCYSFLWFLGQAKHPLCRKLIIQTESSRSDVESGKLHITHSSRYYRSQQQRQKICISQSCVSWF